MASQKPALPAIEPTYNISRPFKKIIPIYAHPIPTCPGKSIVALRVEFPPNGSTPPHTHAAAFVSVNVVSGFVYNKMNNEPMAVFGPGETFTEGPGCRHVVSDNASVREPAVIVATMVVDTRVLDEGGVEGCVVVDEVYREAVMERKEAAAVE
ncbi:hypothetical protein LOCC1_G001200 [Lachnellula occidentalis]|uniref:Cupin 2 conserved barrel domain-containing protein n=1 Tax=Lachnellula occidentalis TaxID=215460 RepID=A0A8H8S8S7_9HELO|nr:hypothetical protein LOCC1_G001200 [Lachnellula occidentalis]